MNKERWLEALSMQIKLQEFLKEKQGVVPPPDKVLLAILAELGEFINEVGSTWKWWKRNDKTLSPADRSKALDELADVLHFVFTLIIVTSSNPLEELSRDLDLGEESQPELFDALIASSLGSLASTRVIAPAHISPADLVLRVLDLGKAFISELTEDELLDAYMKKARVNLKRWEV